MKYEFRMVKKDKIQDLIEKETVELYSKKRFDQKLRELRKDNYVLEYHILNNE